MDKTTVESLTGRLSFEYLREPCPFCGGDARFAISDYSFGSYITAKCSACGARVGALPIKDGDFVGLCKILAARWNKRFEGRTRIDSKPLSGADEGYVDDALIEARRLKAERQMAQEAAE